MKRKRTSKISWEVERLYELRTAQTFAWCEDCGGQVEMVTPDEAASRTRTSSRAVYRLVEAGAIHFIETPGGSLRICLNSLSDQKPETSS